MGIDGAGHPLRRGAERLGRRLAGLPARDRGLPPKFERAKNGGVMMRRAVFLDRDGVLVCAAPMKEYAHGPLTLEDFSLLPGVAEPVQRMRDAGFLTVLATNQPAIACGQVRWDPLNEILRLLRSAV